MLAALLAEAVEHRLGARRQAVAAEVPGREPQHARGDLEAAADVADVAELAEGLEHAVGGGPGQPGGLGDLGRGARRMLLVEGFEDREGALHGLHGLGHVAPPSPDGVRNVSSSGHVVHLVRLLEMVVGALMPFAKQHWYVAATVDEVGRDPLGRTVCGEHVVLFRRVDGTVAVLDDRCSHRGYPLSVGAVVGDEIQCGYHGLRFDGCGTCVWAPGQERIPTWANIVARPAVERGPWVWVWMGAPDDADPSALPEMAWLTDPAWSTVHGVEPLAARASLLIDNLLDLSHETFLHAGYIGTPEVADTPITTQCRGQRRPRVATDGVGGVPTLLCRLDRAVHADRPLAGHRVPRARLLPVARARRPSRK